MIKARLDISRAKSMFDVARITREAMPRIETAALSATNRAANMAKDRLRGEFSSAGLGRLGQAIGSGSDQQKNHGVKRTQGGFSASGWVHVRAKSQRTLGAIEAYTKGAQIRPVRSRWLWIPTDEIQRVSGSGKNRARLTPGNWVSSGMANRVGPLKPVRGINGYPMLVVEATNVPLSGRKGRPRASLKNGRPPKGYAAKQFLVAFIGIPFTAREARVDVEAVMRSVQAELPALFNQAYGAR